MLSSLLAHADDDPQTAALLREGGDAFVSQSLRPYLVSALLDRDPAHRVAHEENGQRRRRRRGHPDRRLARVVATQRVARVEPDRPGLGGSAEVQRGIIADRVLKLPKE